MEEEGESEVDVRGRLEVSEEAGGHRFPGIHGSDLEDEPGVLELHPGLGTKRQIHLVSSRELRRRPSAA